MLSSPHTALSWAGLGFQAHRLNLWANRVSASAEHCFGARRSLKRLSVLRDLVAQLLLHKNLSQQTLCLPLPRRNLPWPGGNKGWTLFSALGRLRLSPRSALALTITPFRKLRGGNETDLLNLYAAVQIQHHCQVKSLAPLTAPAEGRKARGLNITLPFSRGVCF